MEPVLLDRNEITHRQKAMFADATHHNQVFRSPEWTVFLTMFDDPFREAFADSRQVFEFFSRSGVDIDSADR